MSVLARLEQWKGTGAISGAQYDAISALTRKDRFSVFVELNALLYLGVLSCAAGIGWTVTTYSARLGDVAILSCLTCVCGWSLHYCVNRARPYTHRQVESPDLAFDYVLYLGCLVFAIELGYLESRFHPFALEWDHSLLLAAVVFFALAYRFDNRLVLSLALSSLAARCGVRVSRFGLDPTASLRPYGLAYGSLVAVGAAGFHHAGIKKHFLDTYLHVAGNVLFIALVSGAGRGADWLLYMLALPALAGFAIVEGVRYRRFAFVIYGILYGYAGISTRLVRQMPSFTMALAYVVVSGSLVIVALIVLARRFGRDG